MSSKEKKNVTLNENKKQKVMKPREHVAVDCSTLELRQLGKLDEMMVLCMLVSMQKSSMYE